MQGSLRQARWAAASGWLALLFAVAVPVIAGSLRPDYSHVSKYISELGETGSPHAVWVNWAGFFPTGLLVLLFLVLVRRTLPVRPRTLLLLSSLGWAYVISAICPCDPGCPCTGPMTLSQVIHNLTAAIGYPAMIVGLWQAARAFRADEAWRPVATPTVLCAVASAAGFIAMLAPPLDPWRGLVQLVVETSSFGWIAAVGWWSRKSTKAI